MKLTNLASMTIKGGRNIINSSLFETLKDEFEVKGIENDKEEFTFDTPIKFGDLKKLFDLELNLSAFNPLYFKDKLALAIKDKGFLETLRKTKESLSGFEDMIKKTKSELVEDLIVLPESLDKENLMVKLALNKIEDMIEDKLEKVTAFKVLNKLNDYREKLATTLEASEKAIEIMNNETLFDKDILDVPKGMEEKFIEKKTEIIERSKQMIKDIGAVMDGLTEVINMADKSRSYENMFELEEDIQKTMHINRM